MLLDGVTFSQADSYLHELKLILLVINIMHMYMYQRFMLSMISIT